MRPISRKQRDKLNSEHAQLALDWLRTAGRNGARRASLYDKDGRQLPEQPPPIALAPGEQQKFVEIEKIAQSANAAHAKLTCMPRFVQCNGNREEVLLKDAETDLERAFREDIPLRTPSFPLLWSQRLYIFSIVTPPSEDVSVEMEIADSEMKELTPKHARKVGFSKRYTLEAGGAPTLTLCDLGPGWGKTAQSIIAALVLCCRHFKRLKKRFAATAANALREPNSNLVAGAGLRAGSLARLVLVLAPAHLLAHWTAEAENAIRGSVDHFGSDVAIRLWRGRSARQSVQAAFDTPKTCFVWILPLCADSYSVLHAAPEVGVACLVLDEISTRMMPRYAKAKSPIMRTFITSATPEAFSTKGEKLHPLRLALSGDEYVAPSKVRELLERAPPQYALCDTMLDQAVKVSLFSCTNSVYAAVSQETQRSMPRGVSVLRLSLLACTLSGCLLCNEFAQVSLVDLVSKIAGLSPALKDVLSARIGGLGFARPPQLVANMRAAAADMRKNPSILAFRCSQAVDAVITRLVNMFELKCEMLPIDPIGGQRVVPDEAAILTCCTAIVRVEDVKSGKASPCPVCGTILVPSQTLARGEKRKAEEEEEAPPDADDEEVSMEEEVGRKIDTAVSKVSAMRLRPVEGLAAAVQAVVAELPTARMFIALPLGDSPSRLLDALRAVEPTPHVDCVSSLSCSATTSEAVFAKYNDRVSFPRPRIILANSDKGVSETSGMNLGATDVTILDFAAPDRPHVKALLHQACGRSLRLRPRPEGMAPGDTFPAKRTVLLSLTY